MGNGDRGLGTGGRGELFIGSVVRWFGGSLVRWFVGSVVRGRGIRLPRADGSALAMTGAHNPLESPLPLRQAQDRLKGENRPQ